MSSKTKKNKKKSKPTIDLTNQKIYGYFTNEEIAEVKSILKSKDATGVPFVIAATCLCKFELLKNLLKDGYNVNQTGQSNMTALMWAVKYKHLDIADYLLNNGADPTLKTDSGDNVVILALEHKHWDETSMIHLWKSIKRVSYIDVNFTNKNGHNILHMCVRRDWKNLLKIILLEKPNIDGANSNGVTPLMMACFRNNVKIIEILLEAGADVLKEDNHGRMTLCYAISSAIKLPNPPFLTIERIIEDLKKKSSLEIYLSRRVELIIATAKKTEIPCAMAEMLIKIVHFSVQHFIDGVSILLGCAIFANLLEVLKSHLDKAKTVKFVLAICIEFLFYDKESAGFKQELYNEVLQEVNSPQWLDVLVKIGQSNLEESKIACDTLILSFRENENWRQVLEKNSTWLLSFLNNWQTSIEDETHLNFLKKRMPELKEAVKRLTLRKNKQYNENEQLVTGPNCSRKSRRKSIVIKAKFPKMKSVETTKRCNIGLKKLTSQKSKLHKPDNNSKESGKESKDAFKRKNPIVCSLQHLLKNEPPDTSYDSLNEDEAAPIWERHILKVLFFENSSLSSKIVVDQAKLSQAVKHLRFGMVTGNNGLNSSKSLATIVDYLKQLLHFIVSKYQEHWKNDRASGNCNCLNLNEHVPWFFSRHLQEIETKEVMMLQELQTNFSQVIKSMNNLLTKDLGLCLGLVMKVESVLLNYQIRGVAVLCSLCERDTFSVKYSHCFNHNENFVMAYMEAVLNKLQASRQDIEIEIIDAFDGCLSESEAPPDLYRYDMSLLGKLPPKNKRKEVESKLNTIANGFHLINSIMSVCDEDTDFKENQKIYNISDLNYPFKSKYLTTIPYPEISEYVPQRLKSQITSLQNSTTFETVLDGKIRIASKEQRVSYIISAGINFSAVELGLDGENQPLAVKRVPRLSWVGKILKTLVDPLLGLTHKNLLPYFACDYEHDELILATPACKWTMTQYIHILRRSSPTAIHGPSTMHIVRQLLYGLMVLHKYEIPIVHGNLKPANILIDFDGVVRISEFGIHKALYKIIEAPKSSLIWFSRETLDIYQNSSIVECSVKSDVQVAGMLVYFLLTYGKHPFGNELDEILRNIQRGIPKINARNFELKDMLLWMLGNDPNGRPNIEHALAHPLFWEVLKKWSFVLSCAGVNSTEFILPLNVEKLYRSIDTFSEPHLTIEWHDAIKTKLPTVRILEPNNLIGLLKYIKFCCENLSDIGLTDTELSCIILSLFPLLPVGLYRTLQHTNWFKHSVFMPFVEIF